MTTERKLGDEDAREIVEAAYAKYSDSKSDAPLVVAFMAGAIFGFKLAVPREGDK